MSNYRRTGEGARRGSQHWVRGLKHNSSVPGHRAPATEDLRRVISSRAAFALFLGSVTNRRSKPLTLEHRFASKLLSSYLRVRERADSELIDSDVPGVLSRPPLFFLPEAKEQSYK